MEFSDQEPLELLRKVPKSGFPGGMAVLGILIEIAVLGVYLAFRQL